MIGKKVGQYKITPLLWHVFPREIVQYNDTSKHLNTLPLHDFMWPESINHWFIPVAANLLSAKKKLHLHKNTGKVAATVYCFISAATLSSRWTNHLVAWLCSQSELWHNYSLEKVFNGLSGRHWRLCAHFEFWRLWGDWLIDSNASKCKSNTIGCVWALHWWNKDLLDFNMLGLFGFIDMFFVIFNSFLHAI